MRPPESFIGQPIRSLQTMLEVIARNDGQQTRLTPDGIYGPETVQAVTAFQRLHGLPVTGVTNQETWDTVVSSYETALVNRSPAQPLCVPMPPGAVVRKHQSCPSLCIVESILHVLSQAYSCPGCEEISDCMNESTADALTSFQLLCGLPISGCLDLMTWKYLSLHYPLAAVLIQRREAAE